MNELVNKPTEAIVGPIPEILYPPCSKIRGFEGQPRKWFDPVKLAELALSIETEGQLDPAKAKRLNPPEDGFEFELIDGERRWRAAALKGIERFLIIITPGEITLDQQYVRSVISNFFHEMPTVVETAHSIGKLKNELGFDEMQIALRMGRSIAWVYQHYKLLQLHPEVLKLLSPPTPEGKRIAYTIALTFADFPHEHQLVIAKEVSEKGLSMKRTIQLVQKVATGAGIAQKLGLPRREFRKLQNFVRTTSEHADAIHDQPESFFNQAIRGAKPGEMRELIRNISDAISNLESLKETIEKAAGGASS